MGRIQVEVNEEDFHPTLDPDEVDEISEGGSGGPNHPIREQSLQAFLAEQFGEDAPSESESTLLHVHTPTQTQTYEPPQQGQLPSLGWTRSKFKTKSAAIRFLLNEGHSVNAICKFLDVKYQHVRNVKVSKLKRGPNEDWNLERRAITEREGK